MDRCLARWCCSSAVKVTRDPCSQGWASADPGYALPLVAMHSMERPAKLGNKVRNLGDGTETSPHRGALSRFEWLRTGSTQLVASARRRWSTVQMPHRGIGTLGVCLR